MSLEGNFVEELTAARKETNLVAKQHKANNAALTRNRDQAHDAILKRSRTASARAHKKLKVDSSE